MSAMIRGIPRGLEQCHMVTTVAYAPWMEWRWGGVNELGEQVIHRYQYGLCLDGKDFPQYYRYLSDDAQPASPFTDPALEITTVFTGIVEGWPARALVCMPPITQPASYVHALLVHEAVLIWGKIRERRQKRWTMPQQAVFVEHIAQDLFEAYAEHTGGRLCSTSLP